MAKKLRSTNFASAMAAANQHRASLHPWRKKLRSTNFASAMAAANKRELRFIHG